MGTMETYSGLSHLSVAVAKRLRCWTRDLGVWGSIPASTVMCKNLGQALNPHCLWPPSSNGYLGHVSKVGSTCAGCALVAAPYRGRKRVGWTGMHGYQDYKICTFTFTFITNSDMYSRLRYDFWCITKENKFIFARSIVWAHWNFSLIPIVS